LTETIQPEALAVHPKAIVPEPPEIDEKSRPLMSLSLAALGVVYGDIGTSPLYALKECFKGVERVAPTTGNVLGVLSLIVWSLILVVSIKYLWFILKADNRGEGGIIALVALLNPWGAKPGTRRNILMLMGLFGAALLFGDGTITPAISVLSAIEGLKVETSAFDDFVVPITIAILLGLFAVQRQGTTKIGALFGPVMLLWFLVVALLGIGGIAQYPGVFVALDPFYAVTFLFGNGLMGYLILGTVFLAVTGGEALYADMGHFGRDPIRIAWFFVALPSLLLNYFGQGAGILANPPQIEHPFYSLSPVWMHYPLILLATMATIIASQAVISGVFSLTRQAVQLGQLPRVSIVQTDRDHIGQIYIPFVNWALMLATIGLVVGFRTSGNLAAAYGLAVSADMVITTCLAFFVALRFGWNPVLAVPLAGSFLLIDMAFFGSNMFKFFDGGWYPVLIAALIFTVMAVWRQGTAELRGLTRNDREPLDKFFLRIKEAPPLRVPGTAIYMTSVKDATPSVLLRDLDHASVLHERVIFVTVVIEDVPRVPSTERVQLEGLAPGFYRIVAHYGFMQSPNIRVVLRFCSLLGLEVDPETATFYLGHETVVASPKHGLLKSMQVLLFAFLWRNTSRTSATYNLPPNRTMAIGQQIEL
jgi:KUP system potassium uptake protein